MPRFICGFCTFLEHDPSLLEIVYRYCLEGRP